MFSWVYMSQMYATFQFNRSSCFVGVNVVWIVCQTQSHLYNSRDLLESISFQSFDLCQAVITAIYFVLLSSLNMLYASSMPHFQILRSIYFITYLIILFAYMYLTVQEFMFVGEERYVGEHLLQERQGALRGRYDLEVPSQ